MYHYTKTASQLIIIRRLYLCTNDVISIVINELHASLIGTVVIEPKIFDLLNSQTVIFIPNIGHGGGGNAWDTGFPTAKTNLKSSLDLYSRCFKSAMHACTQPLAWRYSDEDGVIASSRTVEPSAAAFITPVETLLR
jgi:hypothetical protein